MTKTVAASTTTETRLDGSDPAPASGGAPGPRPSGTEADKIRRQMHLRRKIKIARRALAAHRR